VQSDYFWGDDPGQELVQAIFLELLKIAKQILFGNLWSPSTLLFTNTASAVQSLQQL